MGKRDIWYLGTVVSEVEALGKPAISLAANRWQHAFVGALIEAGVGVRLRGHIPERLWPRGPAWTKRASSDSSRLVGYVNLPGLRDGSISSQLFDLLRAESDTVGPASFTLVYNLQPGYLTTAQRLQSHFGVPWVAIIADAEEGWEDRCLTATQGAHGLIFLSKYCYDRWHHSPKLHVDGGVTMRAATEREVGSPEKILLYAGSMGKFGGVDLLLDAFRVVREPDVKLWLCGKAATQKTLDLIARDPRARYFGAVSDKDLEELFRSASAFANPRPSQLPENRHNFPSKLLEYLAYGKPIVSTWTAGLSEEFREVLIVPREETVQGLADAIERALTMGGTERDSWRTQIERFVEKRATWSAHGRRVVDWLDAFGQNVVPK